MAISREAAAAVQNKDLKTFDGEQRSEKYTSITKRYIHNSVKNKMHTAFKKDIIKKIHKTPEENWRRIVINEVRKKIIPELPNRENTFNDLILPQISNWISDSPEIINFMKFLHNIRVKPLLTDDELNEDIMKEFDIIFKIHDLNKAHPEKLEEAKRRGLLGGRKTKRKRKRKGKRTRRRRKKTRRKRKGGKKRKTRRRKIMVGCRKN